MTLFQGRTLPQKKALAKEITDVVVRMAEMIPDAATHGVELFHKGEG